MNERFVCVKVDREERPDVDAIYMDAVQAMTGHGGWPLNAFLTPGRRALLRRHVLPAASRATGCRAGARCSRASRTRGREQREEIEQAPRADPCRGCRAPPRSSRPAASSTRRRSTTRSTALRRAYDAEHGGWGGAPKFPQASVIEFLLRRGEREMALHTLRRMARGGMYDQVGGGFARYSVDARWIVPHFEKMLYDNALLARAYLHGWQVTGEPLFRRVCEETLDWALRELRQEEGGFASALDADSEGVEGKFYVWTPDAGARALGDELALAAIAALRHQPRRATSRARASRSRADARPRARWPRSRPRLLAAREQRVRPGLDDKRLTAWNALMISALAEAGAVLERADYLDAAVARRRVPRCATCATTTAACCAPTTAARRSSPAYLEDHAFLLEALLTLYEATFDAALVRARRARSPSRSSTASPTPSAAASSPSPTTTSS